MGRGGMAPPAQLRRQQTKSEPYIGICAELWCRCDHYGPNCMHLIIFPSQEYFCSNWFSTTLFAIFCHDCFVNQLNSQHWQPEGGATFQSMQPQEAHHVGTRNVLKTFHMLFQATCVGQMMLRNFPYLEDIGIKCCAAMPVNGNWITARDA